MTVITKSSVWRDYTTDGVPGSGFHDPDKAEIRQYLGILETMAASGAVMVATKAELDAITDKADNAPGWVVADSTGSNNGIYAWGDSGSAWTKLRGLPDTAAVLTNIGGTANAITADTETGIDPAIVQILILPDPPGTNTSTTVTIAIDGGSAESIKSASGSNVAIGDIIDGVGTMFFRFGSEWRQLFSSAETGTLDFQGVWDGGTTYTQGQFVTKNGILYFLDAASSLNEDPVSGAPWVLVVDFGSLSVEAVFEDVADASATSISANAVRTLGYADVADAPHGEYVEVTEDASPVKSYQFRSNVNTKRWALSNRDVDIRQIGCTPAGLDNASRIQELMDARSGDGGGRIIVPSASALFLLYDEDEDGYMLSIPSGIELIGVGGGAGFKAPDSVDAWTAFIRTTASAEHTAVTRLILDGNRDGQAGTTSQNGLVGGASISDFVWSHVTAQNFNGRSIVTNLDGDLVTDDGTLAIDGRVLCPVVKNSGEKAVQARRCKNVSVIAPRADTNKADSMSATPSAFEASFAFNVEFLGGIATHQDPDYGPSFRAVNGSDNIRFIGGGSAGGRQGMVAIDVTNVLFQGITCKNTLDGVLISHVDLDNVGRVPTENITVDHCTIIDPTDDGVVVTISDNGTAVNNVLVTNNRIYSSGSPTMSYGIRNSAGSAGDVREWGNEIVGAATARFDGPLNGIDDRIISESFGSGSVTIADDGVYSFPAPNGGNHGIIIVTMGGGSGWSAAAMYRKSPNTTELFNGSGGRIDFTTGALTGTTGTDTDITVSIDSGGTIYIENRNGVSREVEWTIMNAR